MHIPLETYEYDVAYHVAVRRHQQHIDVPNKHGRAGKDLSEEVHAAAAEMAVAKALNLYWGAHYGVGGIPDVGPYSIKHTQLHDGCLIVRPNSSVHDHSILVTGTAPYDLHLRGHITGWNARQREWKQAPSNRPAAWFVPQHALAPIHELLTPQPVGSPI